MEYLINNYDAILEAVGAVVVAASALVVFTPTKKDDEILGKIKAFISRFGVFNPDVSVFNKKTK
jgi:hypothetical protein